MTSSGDRVCGPKADEKITTEPSSSIFSFWGSEKDAENQEISKDNKKQSNNKSVVSNKEKNTPVVVSQKIEITKKIQEEVAIKPYPEIKAYTPGVALSCTQESLLFPKQTLSTDTESLDVLADRSEISKKDNYLLTGNVSLNSSQYYLAADTINIQKSSKTSMASGNVKFQDDELMFTGNKATVKKQGDTTYTTVEQANFHYPESKINGKAQKVTNDGTEQVFNSASYSLCPLGNTDWRMKADQITLNSETNKGIAKDVTVEFLGVPIFYSPYHEWVLEGRGSGFLAPSFGSYDESVANEDNNYQVRIPYYFNIAPDRDFLLTLNHLSSRGSVVEGIYRQLITESDYWKEGRFEIEGHYLNEDDITNNKRWLLNSKINLSVNDKININATTNRVSDVNYFKDIAHNNTSASSLHSQIDAAYKDDDRSLILSLFAETEQLINSGTTAYTRAPELSISKSFEGLSGRNINLSLVSTKFAHNSASETTGVRTHAQAGFKRSISTDAYSLTPSLNLSTTDYSLDNSTDQDRSIYSFGIDSKLFLEREDNLFGKDIIQTLTPRLAYNYTPKKNQSALPSFDSADKNDSYESLFSGQKFTGIDRISNANSFTLGLESDFIDEETGDTYLSLKAAQTHHIDSQDMDSNGNLVDRRKYSDIAASADFAWDNLTFNNALQYDPETNRIDKRDSAITYQLSPRKFLTIAHHDDNGTKSAELYGAYPIITQVHVFAGINRSITDSITNKETTGIAYESCCWAVRLAHFKKHISGNDYDYVTDFELVLKGLTTTSPGLSKLLEEEIPNYLANLDD
ncbi:MAG: LPS assembly protein LptD [Candidatus Thioglobus sp.]